MTIPGRRNLPIAVMVGGAVLLATLAALPPDGPAALAAARSKPPEPVADAQPDKAADDYNMAVWLYGQKKYDLAADEFRNFLTKHPDHQKAADARLGMARALLMAGKNNEAIAAIDELKRKHPKFDHMAEALFCLGQAQAAAGRHQDAATTFGDVARHHCDHYLADWAAARRGEALAAAGDYAEAEKCLAALVSKYLTGKDAEANLKSARDRLEKAGPGLAAQFDALLERAHLNLGLVRLSGGRFDAARQTFEEFLAISPRSALAETARFHLAQSLAKAGNPARAAELYGELARGRGDLAADAAMERALALYQARQFKDAAAAFTECARRLTSPDRAAKARLYAGLCLYFAQDYRGAIERLKTEAGDPEALVWLGRAHLKENRPAEALAAMDASLARDAGGPQAADALLGRADALLTLGRDKEAAEAYQQFADKYPDHADHLRALYGAAAALNRSGQYDTSDKFCDRFLKKGADHELAGQVLFVSGENRFLQKKYKEAAERYRAVLDLHADSPDAPAARYRLAWIHYLDKDFDRALETLDRIDPARTEKTLLAECDYLRGNIYLERNSADRAADALGRYLESASAGRYRDDALLKWSVALEKMGRGADATTKLAQFVKDNPDSPVRAEAEYQLAEALAAAGRYADAAARYKTVAEKFPQHRLAPFALQGQAISLAKKGSNDQALAAWDRLIEKYPDSELIPGALYRRAEALSAAGKVAEARAAYKQLVDRYPQHDLAAAAMTGLAACLQKERKFDEAAAVLQRLASDAKDDKTREHAAYERAWTLQEAGKEKEAAEAWRDLAERFPKSPLAADASFHLAEAAYREKRFADAAALYEKALGPADARLKDKVLYRLGWCRWAEGRHMDAAALFDRLVAECPSSDLLADALWQSAEAFARTGKVAEALERLGQLMDPKYKSFEHAADARLRLGELRALQGRLDDAIATFAALEQGYPKYKRMAEVHFAMGKALFDLKRIAEARARFEKALAASQSETAAKAQFYIGETYLAAGDPQSALKAFLRVLALWSAYKEWAAAAQFETGRCYLDLGSPNEARAAFQMVINKYGDTKWAEAAREQLRK